MKKTLVIFLSSFMLFSGAFADEFLTEAEIKALFTNHSFDIRNETKGKDLKGHADAEGRHYVYIPWKDRTSQRKWWTEGATHCTSHPKRGDSCKQMKKMGNGVYQGITDGEHTHTLSNFRPGRDSDI